MSELDGFSMFSGRQRAVINEANIHGSTYANNKAETARVMQSVFDFYYKSHQAINNITLQDHGYPGAQKILMAKKEEIRDDLKSAADSKVHRSDLRWAFEHLADKKGHWYDETSDGTGTANIPIGISHFLENMDERKNKIGEKFADFGRYKNAAIEMQRRKDWEKIPENLDKAQKAADWALPMLWVAAGGKSMAQVQATSKTMSDWIGYGTKIHKLLDGTIKVSTNSSNWKRMVIEEMSIFVLNKLPIFGSLYAGVIRDMPKAMTFMQIYGSKVRNMVDNPGTFNPNTFNR